MAWGRWTDVIESHILLMRTQHFINIVLLISEFDLFFVYHHMFDLITRDVSFLAIVVF